MQNKLGGPRTEQGKARSSQNATKHGLTSSKMFVLQNENPAAWQEMLSACQEEFQPANDFEQMLVEEIAFAKWRLRRAWTVETALWDNEMEAQAEAFANEFEHADEGMRKALAFQALAEKGKALSLIGRYESRLKRDYRNAIKALEDRRKNRDRSAAENKESAARNQANLKSPNEPAKPQPVAVVQSAVPSATRVESGQPTNLRNELDRFPYPPSAPLQKVSNSGFSSPPSDSIAHDAA